MRPILRGLISYDALLASSPLMLDDFARMNDAIDVQDENQQRFHEANRPQGQR